MHSGQWFCWLLGATKSNMLKACLLTGIVERLRRALPATGEPLTPPISGPFHNRTNCPFSFNQMRREQRLDLDGSGDRREKMLHCDRSTDVWEMCRSKEGFMSVQSQTPTFGQATI